MKKTLIAIAATATLVTGFVAAAAPANAGTAVVVKFDHDRHGGWDRNDRDERGNQWGRDGSYQIERRLFDAERRISEGRRYGNISRREASRLNDRLDSIKWAKRDYERSGRGLDRGEVAELDRRLDDLSRDIRHENHDRRRW